MAWWLKATLQKSVCQLKSRTLSLGWGKDKNAVQFQIKRNLEAPCAAVSKQTKCQIINHLTGQQMIGHCLLSFRCYPLCTLSSSARCITHSFTGIHISTICNEFNPVNLKSCVCVCVLLLLFSFTLSLICVYVNQHFYPFNHQINHLIICRSNKELAQQWWNSLFFFESKQSILGRARPQKGKQD